jgi:D-lactate dehydrogenase
MKVFFFSTHSYDRDTFDAAVKPQHLSFTYHSASLSSQNASIAQGHDTVCIFVNDTCDAQVLHILHHNGVKAILLRCAGFNNVDIKTAKELGMFVARVPGTLPTIY